MLRTGIFLIAALLVPCMGCEKPKVVEPSKSGFNQTEVIPDEEVSAQGGGRSGSSEGQTQSQEVVAPPDF